MEGITQREIENALEAGIITYDEYLSMVNYFLAVEYPKQDA